MRDLDEEVGETGVVVALAAGDDVLAVTEAAAGQEIVFCCVGNDDDLRSVVLGPDGAFAGMQPGRLAVLYPGLAWLAASRLTGNRELFFPYAMVLAAAVAVLLPRHRFYPAAIGGGVLVAAFLAIRIYQGAGGRVLAVESAAAVAILGIALATRSWTAEGVLARAWIPLAASLVAFACLAL